MTKTLLLLTFTTFLFLKSYSQDYDKSGMSFALATGAGFTEINKMNGGGYANTTTWDFKSKPLYWSAAFAVKRMSHEFGIEYEQQKYESDVSKPAFNLGTMQELSVLKLHYFNLYYKYIIPYEFKKFTPYLKAGLITNIYSYRQDRTWNSGTDFNVNTGAHFGLSLHAGANYSITDNLSAFAEVGYGPIISKFGVRYSFLNN
jgi:opacity protein-like surface antigen